MSATLKDIILTTIVVVVLIYGIDYVITLLQGHSFQHPSIAALLAAIIAANVSRRRKKE